MFFQILALLFFQISMTICLFMSRKSNIGFSFFLLLFTINLIWLTKEIINLRNSKKTIQ